VLSDGSAVCWGTNTYGQLGTGDTNAPSLPTPVSNEAGQGTLAGVASISAGSNHSCAVINGGTVRCWGSNYDGELGDGTNVDKLLPVYVNGAANPLTDVAEVYPGNWTTCARLTDGRGRCWGYNSNGAIGEGSTTSSNVPVQVLDTTGQAALQGIAEFDLGSGHVCARLSNGRVNCWGENYNGQLGNGSQNNVSTLPVVVPSESGQGSLNGVSDIALGDYYTLAANSSGEVWGWGYFGFGENVTIIRSGTPVAFDNWPGAIQ
ncbi:MAG TPA: hypothetical protein VN764_08725, partial [Polyangiaceae bacterium]|nr:hypothetical protein [Polyangiaceae bacterium]